MNFQKKLVINGILSVGCTIFISTMAFNLYTKKQESHHTPDMVTVPLNLTTSSQDKIQAIAAPQEVIRTPENKQIIHVISRGETIQSILANLGLDQQQIARAIKELQKVYNPKAFRMGQELQIFYTTAGNASSAQLHTLKFKSSGSFHISLTQENNQFLYEKIEIKLTKVLRRVEGNIQSNFYSAALKQGVPSAIIKEAISALSYEVNWQHDPKFQDPFCIVFEAYEDPEGNIVRFGNLKYAAFAPGGKIWHKIYAFKTAMGEGYYNTNGESAVKSLLQTPIDPTKMRITSRFGNRKHPIHGYTKEHKGVDFGAPTGTPVLAAGNGVVVKAGWNGAYGNYILIRHNGEYSTAYGHLSKIAVKPGQLIKQRQVIGNVGSTGNSTGPHLHHEVIFKGRQINPQSVKQMPSEKLSQKDMARFIQVKQDMEKGTMVQTVAKKAPSSGSAASLLQVASAKTPNTVG